MSRRRRSEPVYARQGGAKVHVVGNARQPWAGTAMGRCGALLEGPEYLAHMVPENERCGGGCGRHWPPRLRVLTG